MPELLALIICIGKAKVLNISVLCALLHSGKFRNEIGERSQLKQHKLQLSFANIHVSYLAITHTKNNAKMHLYILGKACMHKREI